MICDNVEYSCTGTGTGTLMVKKEQKLSLLKIIFFDTMCQTF